MLAWVNSSQAESPLIRQIPEATQSDELSAQRQDMESDPELYLRLIGQMQEKNLYFASLAHLDAFDRRWPANPRATLLRAEALRETAYLDQAGVLYESLLQGPLAAAAHHGLGIIASNKGEVSGALQALTRANRLDPTNAAVLNDLGYIQLVLRQWSEAGFNLHKATELDPKNSRAGANLALYYLLANQPMRAEGTMNWYRLTDRHRKEIFDKAAALATQLPLMSGGVQK